MTLDGLYHIREEHVTSPLLTNHNSSSYPMHINGVKNKPVASILSTRVGGTVIENMLPRLDSFSEVGKGRWPGPREY